MNTTAGLDIPFKVAVMLAVPTAPPVITPVGLIETIPEELPIHVQFTSELISPVEPSVNLAVAERR